MSCNEIAAERDIATPARHTAHAVDGAGGRDTRKLEDDVNDRPDDE